MTCSKTTYAQCSHVLQHKPVLDSLLNKVDIKAKNRGLLYVLLYELLLGPNQKIKGGGALKRELMNNKDRLVTKLDEIQKTRRGQTTTAISATSEQIVTIPRYIRINTLVSSTSKILEQLN